MTHVNIEPPGTGHFDLYGYRENNKKIFTIVLLNLKEICFIQIPKSSINVTLF